LTRREQAPVKTFVARVLRVHTEERAWRVGADGEEEVARRLRKLKDGWHILHAVPIGTRDADIDHVVIGPGGIFTLNTKNHRGKRVWISQRTFLVNGQRTDYLRNSRHEATRAARLLSSAAGFEVAVEPVIVVLAAELTIKASPDGVHVVAHTKAARWLNRLPTRLPPDVVAQIFDVARRDTTWRGDTRHD
jgi:Nuclease-related domain